MSRSHICSSPWRLHGGSWTPLLYEPQLYDKVSTRFVEVLHIEGVRDLMAVPITCTLIFFYFDDVLWVKFLRRWCIITMTLLGRYPSP